MIRRYIIEADDSLKGFDEAIEKLEREWGAEEIEGSEDCVSREEFERRIKPCDTEDKTDKALYNFAHNTLIGCPSVTPQHKRGKWISHREHCKNLGVMPSGLGAYEWCSNCDCGIDVKEFHRNYYNFCPNCGADMREVQDER